MQRRQGRRNLLADEFLVKVKDVVTGLLIAGGVIYRKMVSVIGTGVIRANFPWKMKDPGGHIVLNEGCAKSVLKQMEWTKRKDTISKIETSQQFLL